MKLIKFRKGQMAIVMTLAIATLLGVMALGADVGVMYFQWNQLQKGADAAALAGANYLSENLTGEAFASTNVNPSCSTQPDDAAKAACTYAMSNYLSNASLTYNEAPASATPNTPNIQVVATRTGLPYMFGQVLGLSTYNVVASATATQGATGATNNMFPMGIQCNPTCSSLGLDPGTNVAFGVKFTTAVPSANGNWQWLASGNGANGVAAAITSGMPGTYSIGQQINTKTGNFSSSNKMQTNFANLMASCPVLSPDPCSGGNPSNIPSTDPCMVTVPAVNFAGLNGTSTALPIEAFAQVYLEPSSTASSITGCFVRQLDPNAVASGGPDLGSKGRPILVQ